MRFQTIDCSTSDQWQVDISKLIGKNAVGSTCLTSTILYLYVQTIANYIHIPIYALLPSIYYQHQLTNPDLRNGRAINF